MSDTVTITGIAAGGDGVGRLADGRAVFVPRTVPGERVRLRTGDEERRGIGASALKIHKHFARGEIGEIVEAGMARVTPPCPHYGQDRCGGCQLQHVGYDAQLAAKRSIVGDALRRIGKLDVPDPEIVEAVEEWRYGTQLRLAARALGGPNGRIVGLHPYDRPGHTFSLVDCHITDFRLMALWRELRVHLELLPSRLTSLTLRLDRDGRRHVIAESPGEPWQTAEQLRAVLPDAAAVICWWHPAKGAARVVAGPSTGFPVVAFEPENPEMEILASRWAVEQLGELRRQVTWDLYGGIGDTAALLAERGAEVVSVDANERAIASASRRGLPESVRFIAGRAEDLLATLPPPQAVVVSPPAAGLHWDVTLRFTGEPVARLVYISRDPATLARDLRRLSVTYRTTAIKAFDLFPQTARVATVVALEAA